MSVDLPQDFFNRPLAEVDPEIAELLVLELESITLTIWLPAVSKVTPLVKVCVPRSPAVKV